MLNKAQELASNGQHAKVVDYLSGQPEADVERSPTLALLLGIAHARLGRDADGKRWVQIALDRSRERGDRAIEARALNASGAIALESGRIDEAKENFMRALSEAKREGDHATVGRCSNNLGVIANLRGDYGRAVGSYTMALAAFQQAHLHAGVAETLHKRAITYRDQGDLPRALKTADSAVEEAQAGGNLRLTALTQGGRAEIRLASEDTAIARREIQQVLEIRRELSDVMGEAEDLRVLAGTLAAVDETEEAEDVYRDVIGRAEDHDRPLLAAQAERDLARLLRQSGRVGDAKEQARKARVRFKQLGAEAEVAKLDTLIED